MNKDFTKMTDQELAEEMEQMKAEQAAREKAAEEKRKAEEEAKRKAEEAKRQAEEEKKGLNLVEAQKSVLGKCYRYDVYDTEYLMPTVAYTAYYKVIGVYEDKAIVSVVKKYKYGTYMSRSISYVNIDDLVKEKAYIQIERAEFNKVYKTASDGFTSLTDVFENFMRNILL